MIGKLRACVAELLHEESDTNHCYRIMRRRGEGDCARPPGWRSAHGSDGTSCTTSWQASADPSHAEESDGAPNHSDRQTTFAPLGKRAAGDSLTSCIGVLRQTIPGAILILIVAGLSP
jgi:hypothetical protein